jgi:hypothetical protein
LGKNTEHKGTERRLKTAERKRKALELRKAGATYEVIARECGYKSRASAFEAVTNEIRAITKDAAEEVLTLELERLDRLLFGIWEQARGGDVQALDRALRIMDRRASYYGLDVPAKRAEVPLFDTTDLDPGVAERLMVAADPETIPLLDEIDEPPPPAGSGPAAGGPPPAG